MSRHLYLYSPLSEVELALKVEAHQAEFDELLGDSFSEAQLEHWGPLLDELAQVDVQPKVEALSFDDFTADPAREDEQRRFFERARSCLHLEHLPLLESNPFQVTYLKDLLWMLEQVLVDQGGMSELCFKQEFLAELKGLRTMEALIPAEVSTPARAPVLGPIEALVADVRRELARLGKDSVVLDLSAEGEKRQKIFAAFQAGLTDPGELLRHSGLNAKDFGDGLEGLKFYLKKR